MLSGCLSLTQYDVVKLDDILIADGTGVTHYTKAVKLTPPGATTETLPLTRHIRIGILSKPETEWLPGTADCRRDLYVWYSASQYLLLYYFS